MNFSTYTPSEAPQFLMAMEPVATPNPAVIASGWQDFFGEEMDRAIGLQEESFALATRAQSQMAELLDHEDWLTPALTNAFELTAQMVQCFVVLQQSWLAMLTTACPAMAVPAASSYRLGESAALRLESCSEEQYAHSMDIALGERAA